MSVLATAPITRSYWPLSQVMRALELYNPQGYTSFRGRVTDEGHTRHLFWFTTTREAYDEHGGRVGTETYRAIFTCVKKRLTENNPPTAGKIDPVELEEFADVLDLLVELSEMDVELQAPDASPIYLPPDEDFARQHLEGILEMSLINGPAWRWDPQQLLWTLDRKE